MVPPPPPPTAPEQQSQRALSTRQHATQFPACLSLCRRCRLLLCGVGPKKKTVVWRVHSCILPESASSSELQAEREHRVAASSAEDPLSNWFPLPDFLLEGRVWRAWALFLPPYLHRDSLLLLLFVLFFVAQTCFLRMACALFPRLIQACRRHLFLEVSPFSQHSSSSHAPALCGALRPNQDPPSLLGLKC